MTNHSDPTRSNLLKRSIIIFNKNTRYKGSDIRTSAVSKNRRKKHWTSTLFLRLVSIRCIFAMSTIATLRVVGDQDKSRPHLLLVTSIVSPHLPARGALACPACLPRRAPSRRRLYQQLNVVTSYCHFFFLT